jgi:SAM-dependent methyltransferase
LSHHPALHGVFAKLQKLDIFEHDLRDIYDRGFADFWDRYSQEMGQDIAHFAALLPPGGGRVLDLACGSGRVGIALAEQGAQVDGVELSQAMLDLVDERLQHLTSGVRARLQFFQGDMCAFELPHRYDLIVVGATSISLLLERAQRCAMFDRERRHLAPGGKFSFDVWNVDGDRWRKHHDDLDVLSIERDDGQEFAIVGQQFCTEKRTIDLNIFREFIAWDGSTTRTLGYSRKAWLDDAELRTDLEANGLRLLRQSHEHDTVLFVAVAA